jgi:hypothetical protein
MIAAAKNRHHRTMDWILEDAEIMDNASKLDWKVLHAVEKYQGYKSWRCRLSLDRIAAVARCSRKRAGNSSRRWAKWGVLKIKRTGKSNIFEVVQDSRPSPERAHRQRHISQKSQKRDPKGKWAPSTAHQSLPCDGHITRGLLREVFIENPPPPPTGGNGRSSEAAARPVLTISEGILREYLKIKTKAQVRDMLKQGNYPIPEFLLGEEEDFRPEGQAKAEALKPEDPGKGET